MAVNYLNVGTAADSGDGDLFRNAFIKVNDNFSGLYTYRTNTTNFSPTGVLTPGWVGEEVFNVSGGFWFKAVNTNITGWANLNNTYANLYSYQTAAGTQVTGIVTPRFIGDECLRTPENIWYKSVSTNITGWVALN